MVKILWMDDNSEHFSLFVTFVFGIFLFVGTFFLHKRVMDQKERAEVSLLILQQKIMQHVHRDAFLITRSRGQLILLSKISTNVQALNLVEILDLMSKINHFAGR